jgi:hypothetical protein
MAQTPHLGTNQRFITPKLRYSITPAWPGRGRSAIGNQSLALSVVSFMWAARPASLLSGQATFIARFAPLEPIRRESQFLNSCNSLNSFSCHVDR